MNQGSRCNGPGEVRNHADEVRFAQRRYLDPLGDATHVRQGAAGVVDHVLFNQAIEVPPAAPLFPGRDRHFHLMPQARAEHR